MQIITDFNKIPPEFTQSVIALGNFDGAHRGHQEILKETKKLAEQYNCKSAILTFEPHPISILRPEIPPFKLTNFQQKAALVEASGIDVMFAMNFDQNTAQISAHDFIENILVNQLQVRHIIIGHDFIFGHNREGNAALLGQLSREFNFKLTQLNAYKNQNDITFSSTKIRSLIQDGKIEDANKMLGHSFTINGTVEHGDGKAKDMLNCATANIKLGNYIRPQYGVYICEVDIDENTFQAVANIGIRPTMDGATKEWLEVHLLDQEINLYGKEIDVSLLSMLRKEQRFDDIETLKTQINEDINNAKEWFKK